MCVCVYVYVCECLRACACGSSALRFSCLYVLHNSFGRLSPFAFNAVFLSLVWPPRLLGLAALLIPFVAFSYIYSKIRKLPEVYHDPRALDYLMDP